MIKKSIIKKIIIFLLVVAFAVPIGAVVAGMKDSRKYKRYTSYSVDPEGEKALYLLTEKMCYEESCKIFARFCYYDSNTT